MRLQRTGDGWLVSTRQEALAVAMVIADAMMVTTVDAKMIDA